jgi:hypothetical protein
MDFEIVGEIAGAETFATGTGMREIARLPKLYGKGRSVPLPCGTW